jgi:peptidoglycan/LPS O-acetylase OafA/YrhL
MKNNSESVVIADIEVLRAIAVLITAFSHLGELFTWGDSFFIKANSKLAFWGVSIFSLSYLVS